MKEGEYGTSSRYQTSAEPPFQSHRTSGSGEKNGGGRTGLQSGADTAGSSAAVRAALTNTGKIILKDHINHCIVEAVETGDKKALEDLSAAIDQFMK